MTHCVRLLIYPGFVLLDLSGPLEVFANAGPMSGQTYDLRILALTGGMVCSTCGLSVATERLTAEPRDTLIVVGASELPEGPWLDELAAAIARASPPARRTASVCTGAFLLAASGVLDGRAATTQWFYAPRLQACYPTLRVDGDCIYTRDAGVWTSAGMSSGVDVTLAMVEEDLGKGTAQAAARILVVYDRPPGGQYQFSSLLDLNPGSDRIRRTLSFARESLPADLSVERLPVSPASASVSLPARSLPPPAPARPRRSSACVWRPRAPWSRTGARPFTRSPAWSASPILTGCA